MLLASSGWGQGGCPAPIALGTPPKSDPPDVRSAEAGKAAVGPQVLLGRQLCGSQGFSLFWSLPFPQSPAQAPTQKPLRREGTKSVGGLPLTQAVSMQPTALAGVTQARH